MPTSHPITTTADLAADAAAIRATLLEVSHLTRHHMARILDRFEVTLPQYLVLITLYRRQPDGCTMGEIAEAVRQVAATTTGIVDRLVARGVVQRQPDPDDRRAWRVRLTPPGERLVAAIDDCGQRGYERVLAHFAPAERQTLHELLSRYLAAVADELARDSASNESDRHA